MWSRGRVKHVPKKKKEVGTQKTTTDIFAAVRTSDLTKHRLVSAGLTTMGQSQIYVNWKQSCLRYDKQKKKLITNLEFLSTTVLQTANDKRNIGFLHNFYRMLTATIPTWHSICNGFKRRTKSAIPTAYFFFISSVCLY